MVAGKVAQRDHAFALVLDHLHVHAPGGKAADDAREGLPHARKHVFCLLEFDAGALGVGGALFHGAAVGAADVQLLHVQGLASR